jgi:hypothetical protein
LCCTNSNVSGSPDEISGPLAEGHTLIIPKYHSEKLDELPDNYLADILPLAKKIAQSTGYPDYNLLQVDSNAIYFSATYEEFHRTTGRMLFSMSLTSIFI